ncbi:MAG: TIGR04255 family protein [Terriglobales bacterium]
MAAPRQHLKRAPIEEAIIELRVQPAVGLAFEQLAPLVEELGQSYPVRETLRSLSATLHIGREPLLPEQEDRQLGWVLHSSDKCQVVRITAESFSFSRLRPYTDWNQVSSEARRVWALYVRVAEPLQVTRLGTRYVNRESLPNGIAPGRVLEEPPKVPPPAPSSIQRFVALVELRDAETTANATVIQAMEPTQAGTNVFLDIDAYRIVTLSPQSPEIPLVLETLRQLKNRIFFASVTESAVEDWS